MSEDYQVEHTEISSPTILTKIQSLVEGFTRPRRFTLKNCVQPVLEIGQISGIVRHVLLNGGGSFTVITGANAYALTATDIPGGKRWKLLNLVAIWNSSATSMTLVQVGYRLNSSASVDALVGLQGAVTVAGIAVGGDLTQPVFVDLQTSVIVGCTGVVGASTVLLSAVVLELPLN